MFTGKDLGAAIKSAMKKKGVTQTAVANEFGIKQPSVSEWTRFGRVDKQHIVHLVEFFGDVVGPAHWGLPDTWGIGTAQQSVAPPTDRVSAQPLSAAQPDFSEQLMLMLSVFSQLNTFGRERVIDFAQRQLSGNSTTANARPLVT